MITKRRRQQAAFPLLGTRIRGRQRGFETVWTLDRFAEVIRDEVSKGIARAWPVDRIRSWIHTAYEVDPRSLPHAAKAIDAALRVFGLAAPEDADDAPASVAKPPRAGHAAPRAHRTPGTAAGKA
ncbi:hypothetical protein K2Z84_29425, partial [Candidatus Binatia bacterium]|nr:hypothetical protein [Candidatus Binatia bacterium]